MRRIALALAAAATLVAGSALADAPASPASDSPRPQAAPAASPPPHAGPLPAALAIVPGVVVRGAGHFAAGDKATARKLLLWEGIGFGGVATGLGAMIVTGASRKVATAAAAATGVGMGLLFLSLAADVYGAAGGASRPGKPLLLLPAVEADAGYRYIRDPLFDYHHFVASSVAVRSGPVRVQPSVWSALDQDNARYRLEGAWRLFGPRPDRPATTGSLLDLELAGSSHWYGPERFSTRTLEAAVRGRWDLAGMSPSLAGSFAEVSLGWGLTAVRYRLQGASNDAADMLMLRLAYGLYLGKPGSGDGEVQGYYDHRRDAYAGGLPIGGIGGGVMGQAGVRGHYYFGRNWGAGLEVIAGSAWIAGLSLRYRMWEVP